MSWKSLETSRTWKSKKGTITGVNARYVVKIRSITIQRKNYMGALISATSAAMTHSPT